MKNISLRSIASLLIFSILFLGIAPGASVFAQEVNNDSFEEPVLENPTQGVEVSPLETDESIDESEEINTEVTKDFTNIVQQTTDYTCGPAALATLIALNGGKAEEMQVAELAGTTAESGTTMKGLKKAAQDLGYEANNYNWSIEQLKTKEMPLLVYSINNDGKSHFSVVKSINDENVQIADTLAGNIEITLEDFVATYKGKALKIKEKIQNDLFTGELATIDVNNLDEINDIDAENTHGKFVLVDDLGLGVFLIGSAIVFLGAYWNWYFSKHGGASKKSMVKGIQSLINVIKDHENKINSNPNSPYRNDWEKHIKKAKDNIKKYLKRLKKDDSFIDFNNFAF